MKLIDKKIKLFNKKIKRKYNYNELSFFFNSMETLINSGIPLLNTLDIIKKQSKDKETIDTIIKNLNKGCSLTESMRLSNRFPEFALDIVYASEETGDMSKAFSKLKNYYIYMNEIKKNLYSTLTYPTILISSIFLLIIFINTHFIPSVLKIFPENSIASLPLLTQINIKLGIFFNEYSLQCTLTTFTIIYLLIFTLVNDYYSAMYNIPFFGEIFKLHTLYNIMWKFQLMMDSGIDIISTTETLILRSKNKIVKSKLSIFLNKVKNGCSVTESVTSLEINDDNLMYFLQLGEETGAIAGKLHILNNIYLKTFKDKLKIIVNFIQPFILVVITIIIAYLVSTFIIPITNLDYIDY